MAILYILIMWIIVSIILIAIWVNWLNKHMIEVLQSDITLLRDIQKLSESLDKIYEEKWKKGTKN